MPKYMLRAQFTPEGVEGLVKEGVVNRVQQVRDQIQAHGGTVEAHYFAYGEDDVYIIYDMPDAASVIAASLAARTRGWVRSSLTVLITPQEMDEAVRRMSDIPSPGG